MAGQEVQLKSGSKVFSVRADLFGVFAFYDVPVGTYEMDATLPPGSGRGRWLRWKTGIAGRRA